MKSADTYRLPAVARRLSAIAQRLPALIRRPSRRTRDREPPYTITFITPFGLEPKGTASARAVPLAKALADRGHAVTLLVPPWNDRDRGGTQWEEDGVRIVNLALPWRPFLDPPALTMRLLRALWQHPPDVIHAFKPKAYSGLAAALWWMTRRLWPGHSRLVIDADDWEGAGGWNEREPYPPALQRLFAWQEGYGLTHTHGVTVASRALESIVWSHGVSPEDTCYLPNGSALASTAPAASSVAEWRERYGLPEDSVVLLYTRFFEFDLERIVAVWRRVVTARPQARLLVVGRGLFGEERRFAALLAMAQVADTVVPAGWVNADELPAHFALADVALYPMDDTLINRTKCPVKLADLLAAGRPVVGEAVGQVTEYLADGAGILVSPGDVEGFAEHVIMLLDEPARAHRIGEAARHRLHENFDWSVQAARLEEFYASRLQL